MERKHEILDKEIRFDDGVLIINLNSKKFRDIIQYCTLSLFKDYKFTVDSLQIARKHLKGKGKTNKDLFFDLYRIEKDLKANGFKVVFNDSTCNDDFVTKVSAKVTEYVAGLVWNPLSFVNGSEQAKGNLADYKYDQFYIDVKSKRRTPFPLSNYDITLPKSQKGQRADFYICAHIQMKFKELAFMGMISKKDFWNVARPTKPGELAPNKVPYRLGTYLAYYGDIHKWDENFRDNPIVPYYA
jgi:hypothetical protein